MTNHPAKSHKTFDYAAAEGGESTVTLPCTNPFPMAAFICRPIIQEGDRIRTWERDDGFTLEIERSTR